MRSRAGAPGGASVLALCLASCVAGGAAAPSSVAPSAGASAAPLTSTVTPASAQAGAEELALHLRRPQTSASGLGVVLERFEIEDVAADPQSGTPAYGMLVAQLSLSQGDRRETVEIASPVHGQPAKAVRFGAYRVWFVSSASEYGRDPVVVVRIERAGSEGQGAHGPSAPARALAMSASPSVSAAAPLAANDASTFVVVVTGDGAVSVAGERLADDAALLAKARQARGKNADVRARIDADRRVTYGRVVGIMDLLRQAGLQQIAFGVSPKPVP